MMDETCREYTSATLLLTLSDMQVEPLPNMITVSHIFPINQQ